MKKLLRSSLFILLFAFSAQSLWSQARVIAHRGFWDTVGSAQNSIAAMQKAAGINCYGSEFDVSITKDGVLVVNHDDNVGKRVIETSNYADFWNFRLLNGETLPTLEQYLAIGRQYPKMKLILEIKPHKSSINEDRAVDATLAMVRRMGMEKQVEYISFSLNICDRLVKYSPDSKVSYLNGDLSPQQLYEHKMSGMDYHYSVYEKHPEWLDLAKNLGIEINVWTVNDMKMLKRMVSEGKIDYITTNCPRELNSIISK